MDGPAVDSDDAGMSTEIPELQPGSATRDDASAPRRNSPVGDPYCRVCGYDLTGCTETSKCPECGGALVDVLMRPELNLSGGTRKRSKARIMGMPAIDIALGPAGNQRTGKARGFLAIGDDARGVVAIGGKARGVVAIGGLAIGGVTVGGTSIGVVSNGGASIGLAAVGGAAIGGIANGGIGIGGIAQGGAAIGFLVRGGAQIGPHRLGGGGPFDPIGTPIGKVLEPLIGGVSVSGGTFIMPMVFIAVLAIASGGLATLIAWSKMNADPGWEDR